MPQVSHVDVSILWWHVSAHDSMMSLQVQVTTFEAVMSERKKWQSLLTISAVVLSELKVFNPSLYGMSIYRASTYMVAKIVFSGKLFKMMSQLVSKEA